GWSGPDGPHRSPAPSRRGLVTLLSIPQAWLERRYGRGTDRGGHTSPLRRMLAGALAQPARTKKNTKEAGA
ncbi:hypothetical protein ACWDA9_35300, partial [Streptomyces sp. NPDC001193]